MLTNTGSYESVKTFRRILLAMLVLVIMFASFPPSQVQAAGSSVGWIGTSVTCLPAKFRLNPGFIGTYDGQWVAFRLWVRNNATGVYAPTTWQYIQAYTGTVGGFYDVPAPGGSIVSIKTEAYFYNRTTNSWDYAGTKYANHYHLITSGSPQTSCRIFS